MAAKIYKRSDRVLVKIDDVTIKVSPLSAEQKAEIQQYFFEGRVKHDLRLLSRGSELAIKYGVKELSGVRDSENNEYKLEFEGENLSDACVDDLLNLNVVDKLVLVCTGLLKGIPEDFTDEQGVKLEGVEIVHSKKEDDSKNVST